MGSVIRDAVQQDFPIIREISHHTWPETYGQTLSAAQIQYMLGLFYSDAGLAAAVADGQKFILLLEDDVPKGFASMQHQFQDDATKINKLYVVPECQGKGFGKSLMVKIAEIATMENSKRLVLNVNRFNKAKEFYQRLGFNVIGSEDIDIGNGYLMEDFVMERRI